MGGQLMSLRGFLPRPARPGLGFTLIEMLVVISILVFLFSLIGVVAVQMREKARQSRCKSMVKRVEGGLEIYLAEYHEFPSGAPSYPDTWPDTATLATLLKGVDFDTRFITERVSDYTFNKEDYCTAPGHDMFLLDPWTSPNAAGHPHIRYRKMHRQQILVWSYGKDKVDQIGLVEAERAGDDISNVSLDF